MANPNPAPGSTAPRELRERLALFLEEHGEREAAARLSMPAVTLLRVVAGAKVRRGSIAAAELGLERMRASS